MENIDFETEIACNIKTVTVSIDINRRMTTKIPVGTLENEAGELIAGSGHGKCIKSVFSSVYTIKDTANTPMITGGLISNNQGTWKNPNHKG